MRTRKRFQNPALAIARAVGNKLKNETNNNHTTFNFEYFNRTNS